MEINATLPPPSSSKSYELEGEHALPEASVPTPPAPVAALTLTPEQQAAIDKAAEKAAKAHAKKLRKRRAEMRVQAPAWAVSLVVHMVLLGGLAVVTLNSEAGRKLMASINSALVTRSDEDEPEVTPIYADPGACLLYTSDAADE